MRVASRSLSASLAFLGGLCCVHFRLRRRSPPRVLSEYFGHFRWTVAGPFAFGVARLPGWFQISSAVARPLSPAAALPPRRVLGFTLSSCGPSSPRRRSPLPGWCFVNLCHSRWQVPMFGRPTPCDSRLFEPWFLPAFFTPAALSLLVFVRSGPWVFRVYRTLAGRRRFHPGRCIPIVVRPAPWGFDAHCP